ncbi:unnamed protein product, partial [Phaeothamnion confervicola]
MTRLTKVLEGAVDRSVAAEKAVRALGKLQAIDATVELLKDSGAGRVVAALRKHADADVAKAAKRVKKHWLGQLNLGGG